MVRLAAKSTSGVNGEGELMYIAKGLLSAQTHIATSFFRCRRVWIWNCVLLEVGNGSNKVNLESKPQSLDLAIVFAVSLDMMHGKELQLDLTPSVLWMDNITVLKYITNETKRFHTLVANRVVVIHEAADGTNVSPLNNKLNPADEA